MRICASQHRTQARDLGAQFDILGAQALILGAQPDILLRPFVGDCQCAALGVLQARDLGLPSRCIFSSNSSTRTLLTMLTVA
jgi:hypothetical protein